MNVLFFNLNNPPLDKVKVCGIIRRKKSTMSNAHLFLGDVITMDGFTPSRGSTQTPS